MKLSERGQRWLKRLSREVPLPSAEVVKLIEDAGYVAHPAWIEFHDQFAGYIEEVAPGDIAVWGLARRKDATPPVSCQLGTIFIAPPEGHLPETIMCADVFPVHDYYLDPSGAFYGVGGPADSFAMKLERNGLVSEFRLQGGQQTLLTHKSDLPEHQKLLSEMQDFLVPEASSKAEKYFLHGGRLLRFNPFIKQMILMER